MRPWKLERAAEGDAVILASSLAEPDYPAPIRALRGHLRAMVANDQAARMAFDQARMSEVDAKNRPEVTRIFDEYGWVTNSLAGKEASHDFWLLVQHQSPEIQRQMLPALEKAAKGGDASQLSASRIEAGRIFDGSQHRLAVLALRLSPPALGLSPAYLNPVVKVGLFMLPVREYLEMDYLVKACEIR